jgi:hypothetical protein
MQRAQGYRRKAAECLEAAKRLPVWEERERMLEAARRWLELAQIAEAQERLRVWRG